MRLFGRAGDTDGVIQAICCIERDKGYGSSGLTTLTQALMRELQSACDYDEENEDDDGHHHRKEEKEKTGDFEPSVDCVKTFIDAGADVNWANSRLETALFPACRAWPLEVVNSLLKAGAKVRHADSKGRTCLINAVKRGHVPIVKRLLDVGAISSVDRRDYVQLAIDHDHARGQ